MFSLVHRLVRSIGFPRAGIRGVGIGILLAVRLCAANATSQWVHPGPDGHLVYQTTSAGDRIMDFSHAGYAGGGVALPDATVMVTVAPSGGADDGAAIQTALDLVATLPVDDGLRGAVFLAPGVFPCAQTLSIRASGVVLRGSGSGADGNSSATSTLRLTGEPHLAIAVRAPSVAADEASSSASARQTEIVDTHLPSGARSFTIADARGFAPGDQIEIRRPITQAWIHFMHMDDLTRDGKPQTWLEPGTCTTMERRIVSLDGNRVIVDEPLSDSFDARQLRPPGAVVVKADPPPRVAHVGIEYLHIASPPQEISHHDPHFAALRLDGQDCWVRDVVIDETMNSVATTGRFITLERVTVRRRTTHQGASRPMEFAPNASDVLLDRCAVFGDNIWFVGTGARVTGPIVILNGTFVGDGRAESHQRWSTGILYDNCLAPDGGIEMRNRGSMGSGHGWTMGWGVVWNCTAGSFLIQNPPGAVNWLIGSRGRAATSPRPFGLDADLPGGAVDVPDEPVAPRSLYLAQLEERLGRQALHNIGYASTDPRSALIPGASVPDKAPTPSAHAHGANLAYNCPVLATNVRDGRREHAAWLAIDDDEKTAWSTDDGMTEAQLEIDTGGVVTINRIELSEPADAPGRITSWQVEGFIADAWHLLADGTTIGEGARVHIPTSKIWKVRLTIRTRAGGGAIRHLGIYEDK